ncbi:MAG: hypothetical protein WC603_02505 [Candidatus Paceibacterota bacterium]|jgi:DNA-binding NarL/FixJ family response regulator
MKKIIIIEDDPIVVSNIEKAFKEKTDTEIISFYPSISTYPCEEEVRNQLKKVCQENIFDFALLDYGLWNKLTGVIFVDILKNTQIPFVTFSSYDEHNDELMELGAIYEINKKSLFRFGLDRKRLFSEIEKIYSLI